MKFYSLTEIAKMLGITRQTALNWVQRGWLRAGKFGRVWRVSEDDLKKFIEKAYANVQSSEIVKKLVEEIKQI